MSLLRSFLRRLLPAAIFCLAALPCGAQVGADDPTGDRAELVSRVYELEYRQPAEAVAAVYPLLSGAGSVRVESGERRIVVHDREPVAIAVLARLAELDRPERSLRIAVQIVGADVAAIPLEGLAAPELPQRVIERLRQLLRYQSYWLLARAELEAREQVVTSYDVGPDYRITFELEAATRPGQVSIRGFRIWRRTGSDELKPLIHTNLSLEVGRPLILGLSRSEASRNALMVVLEASEPGASRS